ncbi:MAG TPA: hypothetical protein LFW21_07375 [Rickettsia endosymbiont of Pyrocoelia pectoralis]|nr:hypothetical protein [Rickettsia endosymbiont of Pyrocoelia pectoralis]
MTKALIFEIREASLVNNEGFNFAMAHDIKQREEFLNNIENSTDTSLQAQLEKKIAGVFRPDIAYSLLRSCRLANHVSEIYKLKLTREIELSKNMKEALLKQIRAVYGNNVKSLEIIAYSNQKLMELKNEPARSDREAEQQYLEAQGLNEDTAWSKVKRYLLEKYGVHIYRSWFNNLTVVEENNETNQIILKPTTNFIGDWVRNKYGQELHLAFRNLNFNYEILRLKPQEI